MSNQALSWQTSRPIQFNILPKQANPVYQAGQEWIVIDQDNNNY